MKLTLSSILLLWLSVVQLALAQGATVEEEDTRYGYFLEGNKRIVRIPFEFYSNLITIPVILNKVDTLRFVLDTGVGSIIVTDPSKVTATNIIKTRKITLNGTGGDDPIVASVAIRNTIQIGGMRANFQNIVLFDEDVLKLSEIVGMPVHGILGYEIFNNFAVTIDFVHKQLTLRPFEAYVYRKRNGKKYAIEVQDSKPFISGVSMTVDGKEHSVRMLIDTGSGHAMMMDNLLTNTVLANYKMIEVPLGRGLNGIIKGSVGRIDRVRLGKTELQKVVATFPEEEAFGAKVYNRHERHGNIGCELLRRFKVTFHYKEGYVQLKPIKRRLRESFEHDMAGMEIRAIGFNYKSIVVNDVASNSPAEQAGIHIGDELLFVNEQPVASMHISDLYKLFQKGDGQRLTIILKREGHPIIITQLTLRRII